MSRVRFPSSLRGRLLALVLVAVLPSFAILIYAERNQRELLVAQIGVEAHDLARLVAERHQRSVDRARGLLVGLARLPSLRALDGAACSRDVAAVLTDVDIYANVGAATPDGNLFCSAATLAAPVNLADRVHFRGPLERGEFTVGGYVRSRSRLGLPSFGFGLPIRSPSGRVAAVAVASLDLVQLQRELDDLPLPPGAEVVVVDRDGVVATGRPAPGDRVGTPLQGPLRASTLAHAPAAEVEGLDGVRRVYGFHDVTAGGETAMRVAAGVPAEAAYAPVRRIARTSILALLAVAAFAIGAAVLGSELIVVRRIRAVVAASRRIAAGDHAARSGLAPGGGEIGELVHAFDDMAGSLERLWRQNRLLLDAVGEGIIGVGADGRITFANPAAARTLGWTVEEMLGADCHDLVHGPARARDACPILAAMREVAPTRGTDETLTRRDGTAFPAEFVSTPLVDAGRVVGVVLVFRDVSERRLLEDRLRQAEKMEAIGQLAGGVAHDFNNLLTAIVSCAQLIGEALPEDHPAQADAREIGMAAGRATALTRQLLAFGRRQRLAPRVVELRAIVRGMESMLRRLLPATVSLRVETPAAGAVLADPAQLETAVLNLVVNARDAVGGGGHVEVRVEEGDGEADGALPGRTAVLVVRDDGVGMDAATRERIFEPFYTTKPAGKGTGLGLATVYGVVSQSGGAIRVRSEPGRGAEFRISFPLQPGRGAEPGGTAAPPPRAGRETVLLVEDDVAIRGIARRALAGAGYRVLDAGSAGDALQIAHGEPGIDALVTDVLLPERNGWELSRDLAGVRPGLRVLFMSGYAAQLTGESVLPEGVPFLAKPFTPDDLLRALRAVLDGPAAQDASSSRKRSA
jgi:two-component system cell cycle sensor histidine kinase/response regulator CckA